jgi:hypothetical protein
MVRASRRQSHRRQSRRGKQGARKGAPDACTARTARTDRQIARLNAEIVAQHTANGHQGAMIAHLDEVIERQDEVIGRQDEVIAHLKQVIERQKKKKTKTSRSRERAVVDIYQWASDSAQGDGDDDDLDEDECDDDKLGPEFYGRIILPLDQVRRLRVGITRMPSSSLDVPVTHASARTARRAWDIMRRHGAPMTTTNVNRYNIVGFALVGLAGGQTFCPDNLPGH